MSLTMMPHDDKLDQTKEQLCKVEEERDRAYHELIQVRKMAEEANSRIDIALASKNLSDQPQPSQTSSTSNNVVLVTKTTDESCDSRIDTETKPPLAADASATSDEVRKMIEKVDIALSSKKFSELNSNEAGRTNDEVNDPKVDVETESKSNETRETEEKIEEKAESDSSTKEEEKEKEKDETEETLNLETNKEKDDDDDDDERKRRIHELEAELNKSKASEANLYESLAIQTKQLQQNQTLVEESKLEIASLREKIEQLQESKPQASVSTKETEEEEEKTQENENQVVVEKVLKEAETEGEKLDPTKAKTLLEQMSFLRNELELAIEGEGEESDDKAKALLDEMSFLKNELKLATEAEENSKKAMDDLALALKEVATEANQTKQKLVLTQVELQRCKEEAEHLRMLVNRTEDTYKQLLEDTRKEAERNHNTAERLRLEAEESLLAWNTETTEFVNCIKRAEEERATTQQENAKLMKLLVEQENKTLASKDENQKLRDILKQALNEANVAKEAAGIAQTENSQLKDVLTRKDEALKMLTQENEMLKIHEAAAFEQIKELKKMLAEAPIKGLKNIEEDKEATGKKSTTSSSSSSSSSAKAKEGDHKEHKEGKSLTKAISFNIKDIISPHNKHNHKEGTEESAYKETDDDDLQGSIFDAVGSDSGFDGDLMSSDEIDESQFDDVENNPRKRKFLLRRFGDLIRRRSSHPPKKETSTSHDEKVVHAASATTTPPHP